MSDIFISYASQDRPKAQVLAQVLEQHGWSVWWDRTIPPGKSFDEVIEEALEGAKCVIVLWSTHSVASHWVKTEAAEGLRRGILVPALIGDAKIPLEFRRIQAAPLMDWKGKSTDPEFQNLVNAVGKFAGEPVTTDIVQVAPAPPEARTLATGTPIEPTVVLPPREKPEEPIPGIRGMVKIRAGEFLYGDEKAKHILPAYYIDIYPVTNAEYEMFVEAKGYENKEYWTTGGWSWIQEGGHTKPRFWGNEEYKAFNRHDHPVVGVSWYEAWAYAKWAGKRLPTELEWEKAARGVDSRKYPWGDAFDSSRCNTFESGIQNTTPVTSYETGKTPYGCYDMAGNVWEWTSSSHKSYPYRADDGREGPNATDYLELLGGSRYRVLRGGSWNDAAEDARASNRYRLVPAYRSNNVGFRCAETP